MRIKRFLLIIGVITFYLIALTYMNYHFDRLARYPYQNPKDKELIEKYLNDEEINYIIKYAIAPNQFTPYIANADFNIYHLEEYQNIKDHFWYLTNEEVTYFTEKLLEYPDGFDVAFSLGDHYHYTEILDWLQNGDQYNADSVIITNPTSFNAVFDDDHTMGKRVPDDLVVFDDEIQLSAGVIEPLSNMIAAFNENNPGHSLNVTSAYLSYDEQVDLFELALSLGENNLKDLDYPGHSEHQTGMSVDLKIDDIEDIKEAQSYDWLINNAHLYGFIQSYDDSSATSLNKNPRYNHFRYVGKALALEHYQRSHKELGE